MKGRGEGGSAGWLYLTRSSTLQRSLPPSAGGMCRVASVCSNFFACVKHRVRVKGAPTAGCVVGYEVLFQVASISCWACMVDTACRALKLHFNYAHQSLIVVPTDVELHRQTWLCKHLFRLGPACQAGPEGKSQAPGSVHIVCVRECFQKPRSHSSQSGTALHEVFCIGVCQVRCASGMAHGGVCLACCQPRGRPQHKQGMCWSASSSLACFKCDQEIKRSFSKCGRKPRHNPRQTGPLRVTLRVAQG